MKCADVRAMAESYLAGELTVDTSHAMASHLEGCEACRVEFEARRALRHTLRAAFRASAELAPERQFMSRVDAQVRAVGVPRRFAGATRWFAVAAGLTLIILAGWQLQRAMGRPAPSLSAAALAAHAAGDHRYCALEHALEEAPISLEEAARRYGRVYAGLGQVVAESALVRGGDVTLLGAHWCVFKGRPFAHVVVRRNDRVVSILLTPMDGLDSGSTAGAAAFPAADGFQIAGFETRGHIGFVVSALSNDENLTLARALAPLLQNYLGRG